MAPTPAELRKRAGDGDLPITDIQATDSPHVGKDDTPLPPQNGRSHVGVDGKWYDVTDFIARHPGGPIIEQFIGQDATDVFHAYGHEDVLKYRKPVGTYVVPVRHPADKDFRALIKLFKDKGFYKTDWLFYLKKTSVVLTLWALVFVCILCFEQWYMHYLAGVIMAFFFQQTGFVMHEFMHTQVFRDRFKDRFCGLIFGTCFFGMSAHWWQDEHIVHHAMTNCVNVASRFVDPQMWESSWAQDKKMFPLFKGWVQYLAIKIQHITFIPIVVFCGRYEIILDSYRVERRWYEWIAIVFHWIWMGYLLMSLPTWKEALIFYFIGASVEGIFHFQLILSHYCKLFLTTDEFHGRSWFETMVLTNMNIDVPWWQDWYYGGLNFHIEHHAFPKMARSHLREAGAYVEEICKKYNIDYDSVPFSEAMRKTLVHLKQVGTHYKLDPR